MQRGLWREFEENYRKARATALSNCDFETLLALDNLQFQHLWESRTHKPQALKHLLSTIEASKADLKNYYATTHAHWGSIYTVASHYLQAYEHAKSWEALKQVDFTDVCPPLAEYYEQKSRAFAQSLHADIASMQQAMTIIFSLPSVLPSICAEQLFALGNVGLAYMLNHDYANALQYYQKAFEFSQTHGLEFGASLAFNYASVLMKCALYKEALEIFRAKWDTLSKGEMTRHRAEVMRCYCHIFWGNPMRQYRLFQHLCPPILSISNFISILQPLRFLSSKETFWQQNAPLITSLNASSAANLMHSARAHNNWRCFIANLFASLKQSRAPRPLLRSKNSKMPSPHSKQLIVITTALCPLRGLNAN